MWCTDGKPLNNRDSNISHIIRRNAAFKRHNKCQHCVKQQSTPTCAGTDRMGRREVRIKLIETYSETRSLLPPRF